VPTFRVIYVPRPGVRLLIEDVQADAVRETTAHVELTLDMLVVGKPREVVALRARRRDVTAGSAAVPYIGSLGWRAPAAVTTSTTGR
jgi:hypothetical protein